MPANYDAIKAVKEKNDAELALVAQYRPDPSADDSVLTTLCLASASDKTPQGSYSAAIGDLEITLEHLHGIPKGKTIYRITNSSIVWSNGNKPLDQAIPNWAKNIATDTVTFAANNIYPGLGILMKPIFTQGKSGTNTNTDFENKVTIRDTPWWGRFTKWRKKPCIFTYRLSTSLAPDLTTSSVSLSGEARYRLLAKAKTGKQISAVRVRRTGTASVGKRFSMDWK